MGQTICFAPLAERLDALAVKIRSELEGRILIEQIYGVMFCIMLHCWVRICHQLDARAEAAARDAAPRAEQACAPAAGNAAPRRRLRLVASRARDAATPPPCRDPGEPRVAPPRPERRARAPAGRGVAPAIGLDWGGFQKTRFWEPGFGTSDSLLYRN